MSDDHEATDELQRQFVAGDEDAAKALFERFSPYLAAIIRRFGLERSREEILCEVWARIWEHRAQYDPSRSFPRWAAAITLRRCSAYLTAGRSRQRDGHDAIMLALIECSLLAAHERTDLLSTFHDLVLRVIEKWGACLEAAVARLDLSGTPSAVIAGAAGVSCAQVIDARRRYLRKLRRDPLIRRFGKQHGLLD